MNEMERERNWKKKLPAWGIESFRSLRTHTTPQLTDHLLSKFFLLKNNENEKTPHNPTLLRWAAQHGSVTQ